MDRRLARAAYDAAVAACDPFRAVADVVTYHDDRLTVGSSVFTHVTPDDLIVVAVGKAAPSMVRGLDSAVPVTHGIVVSDHRESCPLEVMVADHPIPGRRSLIAGAAVLDVVGAAESTDLVMFLVSGGGSALVEVPVDGVTLEDLVALNKGLLASGASIAEMNQIRSAVSAIKGGGLAVAAGAARRVTLVMSDVIDGGPEVVASGPSIPPGGVDHTMAIVDRYGISDDVPQRLIHVIESHSTRVQPTADPGPVVVVSSPAQAARAAVDFIGAHEPVVLVTDRLVGDVEAAVDALLAAARDEFCAVAVGETTVTVRGDGLGGRNQHAALVAAERIEGSEVIFGAFATDGRDGPTTAAGAIVDGDTIGRMLAAGIDPGAAYERFDAHHALAASGDLVVTGPTGTNVTDLWIAGTR